MLTKIRFFSIIPVLALSLQTTISAMETPQDHVRSKTKKYYLKKQKNKHHPRAMNAQQEIIPYKTSFQSTVFGMDIQRINSDECISKWTHEIQINPLKSQLKLISLYKKINSKNNQSHIPYYISYRLNPLDFFSALKQIFSKEDLYDAKITLHTIKSDLSRLITYLKENDLQNKTLIQEEINNTYKQLWNHYLMLHNYSWLDHIMYPCHPDINDQKEEKYRREQLFSLHPDKRKSNINEEQQDDLYKHLTELSRPAKIMDLIIDPINAFAVPITAKIGLQSSAQAVTTACSLPSLLFPAYFTNKETSLYKNALNKTSKEIKIVELNIQQKQQEARDAVRIFSTKNKNLRTN